MGEENRQQKSRLSKIGIKKIIAIVFSALTIVVISAMIFSEKVVLNENVITGLLDFINSLLKGSAE